MSIFFDHNWSTICLEHFDYGEPENFSSVGFDFDSDFDVDDKGQLPTDQIAISEAEFVNNLRANQIESELAPLQNFYENCKKFLLANSQLCLTDAYQMLVALKL